jgi:hypothetical protein
MNMSKTREKICNLKFRLLFAALSGRYRIKGNVPGPGFLPGEEGSGFLLVSDVCRPF